MSTVYNNMRLGIECDECGNVGGIVNALSFSDGLGKAKELGWILHWTPTGWVHFCGRPCRNAFVTRERKGEVAV